jgi:hypothetical protein
VIVLLLDVVVEVGTTVAGTEAEATGTGNRAKVNGVFVGAGATGFGHLEPKTM